MNTISFEPLTIGLNKLPSNLSTPQKPQTLNLNRIVSPRKIEASPSVLNSAESKFSLKTPLRTTRDFTNNSLRHRRLKTFDSNPDFLLQSANNETTRLTTDISLQQSTQKKPFNIPKIPIRPIQTSETDHPLSQRAHSDRKIAVPDKRSKSQKLFSSQDNNSLERKNSAIAENQTRSTERQPRKSKAKPLTDLVKEALHKFPCQIRKCQHCGSQGSITERKSIEPSDRARQLANFREMFLKSAPKEPKNLIKNQIMTPLLSESKVNNIYMRRASGMNFKMAIALDDVSKKFEQLQPTTASRRLHNPARHLEVDAPANHQFASDIMYYETHGELISKKIADRADRVRNRLNGPLADYRRRVNEDFENRFGSMHFTQETENTVDSSKNLDEDADIMPGFFASVNRAHLRDLSTKKTFSPYFGSEHDPNSPSRTFRSRPTAVGLPNAAMLKIPGRFLKNSIFEKRLIKKKTLYNPFERRRSSDSYDIAEDALRDLIEFRPKMGSILPPQNPIFKEPAAQSTLMQEIVTGDLKLRLVRPKRVNFKFFRIKLIEALRYMKLLKLKPRDLLLHHIFSTAPYEKKHSRELLTACKINDQETVYKLLEKNKFLVYDFDNAHMTSLHWAVKRGNFNIVQMLIDGGSDLNAKDLIGRTPLFFAIKYNWLHIMKLLLFSSCDPWSSEECDYTDLCKDKVAAKYYLSKSRLIHIIMKMTPPRLRESIWQKESLNLILDPRHSQRKEELDELE